MNTKNNERRKSSIKRIESTFIQLLETDDIHAITVTGICKTAGLNRSTFYANYLDVYDLVEKLKTKMMDDFYALYAEEEQNRYNSNDFLKLFYHIKDNQIFYKTYFKLKFDFDIPVTRYDTSLAAKYYDLETIPYHIEFFRAGITAIIKKWLDEDCRISPEELFEILKAEYRK